jgi:hypothetical protein
MYIQKLKIKSQKLKCIILATPLKKGVIKSQICRNQIERFL